MTFAAQDDAAREEPQEQERGEGYEAHGEGQPCSEIMLLVDQGRRRPAYISGGPVRYREASDLADKVLSCT